MRVNNPPEDGGPRHGPQGSVLLEVTPQPPRPPSTGGTSYSLLLLSTTRLVQAPSQTAELTSVAVIGRAWGQLGGDNDLGEYPVFWMSSSLYPQGAVALRVSRGAVSHSLPRQDLS